MEKAPKRLTLSFSESDIERLKQGKILFNEKTYSKVVKILLRLNIK